MHSRVGVRILSVRVNIPLCRSRLGVCLLQRIIIEVVPCSPGRGCGMCNCRDVGTVFALRTPGSAQLEHALHEGRTQCKNAKEKDACKAVIRHLALTLRAALRV